MTPIQHVAHGLELCADCPHTVHGHDWQFQLTSDLRERYPNRGDCHACIKEGRTCAKYQRRLKRGEARAHALAYYGTCGYCSRSGVVSEHLDFDGERYTAKCEDRDGCTYRVTARAM